MNFSLSLISMLCSSRLPCNCFAALEFQAKPKRQQEISFLYEEIYEGFLLRIIQRAKLQATRHQSWVLRAEELRHEKSHWGGRSPERSPLEQGMMGT